MPDTETLTPEQLAEIEARLRQWNRGEISKQTFPASWANVDALCRSLRAAWADVARFSTLADERHDLLSAERRANDELRAERAKMLQSLERAQQERNRLSKENASLRTQNQTQAESITYFQENEKSLNRKLEHAREELDYAAKLANQKADEVHTQIQRASKYKQERDELKAKLAQSAMLTEREVRILTDYHNYEAEKAITRTGCKPAQRAHLERLAELRKIYEPTD